MEKVSDHHPEIWRIAWHCFMKVCQRNKVLKERLTTIGWIVNLLLVLGTAIGWGRDSSQPRPLPRELQELDVGLVTLETCQRTYGWIETRQGPNGTRINESYAVTSSMICAGGLGGTGACEGDSGELKQN